MNGPNLDRVRQEKGYIRAQDLPRKTTIATETNIT